MTREALRCCRCGITDAGVSFSVAGDHHREVGHCVNALVIAHDDALQRVRALEAAVALSDDQCAAIFDSVMRATHHRILTKAQAIEVTRTAYDTARAAEAGEG